MTQSRNYLNALFRLFQQMSTEKKAKHKCSLFFHFSTILNNSNITTADVIFYSGELIKRCLGQMYPPLPLFVLRIPLYRVIF